MKKSEITLKQWIREQGGVQAAARILGVTRQTVNNWDRGFCGPDLTHLRKLHRVSGGRVSYAQILDGRKPRASTKWQKREGRA